MNHTGIFCVGKNPGIIRELSAVWELWFLTLSGSDGAIPELVNNDATTLFSILNPAHDTDTCLKLI